MEDFFLIAYLFSGKTVFLQISADFVTGFEKLFFHLKGLQTKMYFFVAQEIQEIYSKSYFFQEQF